MPSSSIRIQAPPIAEGRCSCAARSKPTASVLSLYVLAIRDGCTGQHCKTLALFHDSSRVRTNLTTAALERYLEHYATAWTAGPDVPVADTAQAPSASTAAAPGQPPRRPSISIFRAPLRSLPSAS